jgi:hypothetical protein
MSDGYQPDAEQFEESIQKLLQYQEEDEQDDMLEDLYDKGGLSLVSHLYGLSLREKQFDELYTAYKDFYGVKHFREGHRRREQKLQDLMEAYRDYFGSGSNEQWNEGVEQAQRMAPLMKSEGRLGKDALRDVLKEF